MKLISNIDEVRDQVPVSMTGNIDILKTYLASAENQFIKFMIGKAQYDVLANAYLTAGKTLQGIANENIREAILLCQRAIANLGYLMALPIFNVSIGPSGIQIFSNTDTKSAFQWQVEDVKKSLQEIGYNAIEDLMDHLAENLAEFPEYADSPEFIRSKKYLIQNAKDFNEFYAIGNSRFTFQMLLYVIGRIEQQSVIPIFGSEFFATLKENGISGKTAELSENYIKPGIACLVVAAASVERIIVIDSGIVKVNIGGNYEAVKDTSGNYRQSVKDAADQLTIAGNKFLQDGLNFLMLNLEDIPGFTVQTVKRGRFKAKNSPDKGLFAS